MRSRALPLHERACDSRQRNIVPFASLIEQSGLRPVFWRCEAQMGPAPTVQASASCRPSDEAKLNQVRLDDFLNRSEEHTSELQSLMRISYAVFCLKKKNKQSHKSITSINHLQTV